MRILFFDTETNGLPWNKFASYKNVENWPRILQIAWQVWDFADNRKPICIQSVNTLLQPDPDMKWDEKAASIHRISLEDVKTHGLPIRRVLKWFQEDCRDSDWVLAHNMKFDKSALFAECWRFCEQGISGMDPVHWWPKRELCTMMATIQVCKLPSQYATAEEPYKWPRLSELYSFLWPDRDVPKDLHDASKDVACLVACVHELLVRNLLVLPAPLLPLVDFDPLVDLLRSALRW